MKTSRRLKTIQTCLVATGTTCGSANLIKEYRLEYTIPAQLPPNPFPTVQRSLLKTLRECAMPSNTCKPPVTLTWSEFGSAAFGVPVTLMEHPATEFLDVNSDGRADAVNWKNNKINVSLSDGSATLPVPSVWIASFDGAQYPDRNKEPVLLQDVNGDGLADVVGFASNGVNVYLKDGGTWFLPAFGTDSAWTGQNTHPRLLEDVDGDGLPDIVGFGNAAVYVAINTGSGFNAPTTWSSEFGKLSARAYPSNDTHPRMVADMNGDGLPDIVGFASDGVYIAMNTGTGFAPAALGYAGFGTGAGWSKQTAYPRTLADVNGDGLPDIVGFYKNDAQTVINKGDGTFASVVSTQEEFGNYDGYSAADNRSRYVVDVNGDGRADIVGFKPDRVYVALSHGKGFYSAATWSTSLGVSAEVMTYCSNPSALMPSKKLADMDGDGFPDVANVGPLGAVGCFAYDDYGRCACYFRDYAETTRIGASAKPIAPDLATFIENGLGARIKVTYRPLTYRPLTGEALYERGSDAQFPEVDLQLPMYVVSAVQNRHAQGNSATTTDYRYRGLKADVRSGRGLLGFAWLKTTHRETGLTTRRDYLQTWPYVGLERQAEKKRGTDRLGLVTNTYGCIDPQSSTGAACTTTPGKTYFTYLQQSVESSWEMDGSALPVVTTTSEFDTHGNALTVTVSASDGYSKTTTNTYQDDTTNWYLGRLTRSQVTATAP